MPPMHDYECKTCNKSYTYFHNGSEDKIPRCPACGSASDPEQDKLVPKSTSFSLKGDGWHNTDYNKRGRR